MSWRDRIVCSGEDRAAWLAARSSFIGASDAKSFAKLASVEKYVAAKIRPTSFHGSELTQSGHRWEPMILAFLGVEPNTAFVHAPDYPRFACTPDGISEDGVFRLAEVKTRHNVIKPEPTLGEWRQLAWQLMCFPEAELVRFGTLTVTRDENGDFEARENGYALLDVYRDDPKIIEVTAQIMPIAMQVLAALDGAQRALEEVPF